METYAGMALYSKEVPDATGSPVGTSHFRTEEHSSIPRCWARRGVEETAKYKHNDVYIK